jgi:L-asparaginase/Glu-tRNA(Gln) amidotransferase subunit D
MAEKTATPVFAITERGDAPVALSSYAAGKQLLNAGVLWCHDLTPESALVKAQLLDIKERGILGKNRKQYHHWLKKNWAYALSDETGFKA